MRNTQLTQTNYTLIIGDQELESKAITVRKRDNTVLDPMPINQFLQALIKEKYVRSLTSNLAQ